MDDIIDNFDLSVEERAQFLIFKRELDLLSATPPPIKSEREISRIEAALSQHVQEIVESVSKSDDKTDP